MKSLLFLVVLSAACLVPTGSPEFPYWIDTASTVPATGSLCAPFPSLSSALSTLTSQPTVSCGLLSDVSVPLWTVNNEVTFEAWTHQVTVTGQISVSGTLALRNATIVTSITANSVFHVTGTLIFSQCSITGFTSPVVYTEGKVTVTHSVFQNNLKGVFTSLNLGAQIDLSDSEIVENCAAEGSIFFLYPSGPLKSQCRGVCFETTEQRNPGVCC